MANPNIDLLGAVYPAVAGVTLPKQGGGTAVFPYVEGSQTITQNGTVDVTNLAEVVVNVSGGGGASNVVVGEFTCSSTKGTVQEVDIPYTGSGYPLSISVYVKGGKVSYPTAYSSGCTAQWNGVKYDATTAPTYSTSGDNNRISLVLVYSSSGSASYSSRTSSANANFFTTSNPSGASASMIMFKSNKKMAVYVASNSYGLVADTTYEYVIRYSS